MDTTMKTVLSILFLLIVAGIVGFILSQNFPVTRIGLIATNRLQDNFDSGFLDSDIWQFTRDGDVQASTIDVYDVDPSGKTDYRLRLQMDTLGTRDDTVKFQGIRSVQKVNFTDGKRISFDLDWNNQSNGCYLTAAMYLCPTATGGNPEEENDWLKIEYVGVPPGYNARCIIVSKSDRNIQYLLTEGWPEQKSGRQIEDQHISFILDRTALTITENGEEIYSTTTHDLKFTSAYIYLQMSSHSNYPNREVYFDNILVSVKG